MMSEATVTRSAEGATFTTAGLPHYVRIESGRRVVSSRVQVAAASSDAAIRALRKRLRDNPDGWK